MKAEGREPGKGVVKPRRSRGPRAGDTGRRGSAAGPTVANIARVILAAWVRRGFGV